MAIDFTAGRGPTGFSADVDVQSQRSVAIPSGPIARTASPVVEEDADDESPFLDTVDDVGPADLNLKLEKQPALDLDLD